MKCNLSVLPFIVIFSAKCRSEIQGRRSAFWVMIHRAIAILVLVGAPSVISAQQITAQRLMGRIWGPEDGGFGYHLEFKENGLFQIFAGPEGGGPTTGTYTLSGDSVMLTPTEGPGDQFFEGASSATFLLRTSTSSIFGTDYLTSAGKGFGQQFWDSSAAPVGKTRVIDGVEATIVERRMAKCTVDLSIRSRPSAQAQRYIYIDPNLGELRWLPKGTRVHVLARNQSQETIDGLRAYWYYVMLFEGFYERATLKGIQGRQAGWMFGGYLK
jgi:hypothetical protein